jgi:myo-inositol-1(or 4)-monophosphatase
MREDWLDEERALRTLDPSDTRASAAARLAMLGGRMALERFGQIDASWKADGSMLTRADLDIQAAIAGEIRRAFPGDGVLGEEGLAGGPRDAAHRWILDPIDGTNNFGRGLPGFSVSVGVLRDGQPVAGAVYDPMVDWLFSAAEGQGARLNGRRVGLRPSALSRYSLFTFRSPCEGGVREPVRRWLERYRLRRFGSTALHLCYVALGAVAFVHDHGAAVWDVAGAAAVLLEAGGALARPDGRPLFPLGPAELAGGPFTFVAGNPVALRQVLDDLRR